ncbi:Hypothetical protein PENO1_059970 [Penicillium occitanis (nom. inval.)]|nr:Hypothetical protein PENO1_059970 [Penicillium occitanis (nom. inval.)]PCH01716.1 hypothetical protein PENOC_046960 [Penicillium occitanis (nom. inval.)]
MEHPVKMREIFTLRPMQFTDEGDNESTMSLDLNAVDCQIEDGQIYDAEDDAYSWSDDEWDDSSVELDSTSPTYSQEEAERLELMHLIFTLAADGYLHLAPINWHLQRILDVGCGTGTWCIEMADAYPSAEVVGVELSPSQPMLVPPNLSLQIDEFDDDWTYSRPFDYIHARFLAGRIHDWARLMRQCFENCNSGGWVEFQDIDALFTSQHESLSQSTASKGEVIYPGPFLAQWMHEAGFINIRVVKRNQPMVSREDAKLQQLDLCSETRYHELSTSMKSFANNIRWNQDRENAISNDLMSNDVHGSPVSIDLYIVYGQRP